MKKLLPLMQYIPLDFLIDADWKLRMSERSEEIAGLVTVEMVMDFAV